MSNSQNEVLITSGLYFPNYCITYLPRDISRDFEKCKHVNLRGEWTRAVFEELYYAASNQMIADKKKADYQEVLENSHADSAARNRDSYTKTPGGRARSRESYKKDFENSRDGSAVRIHESYGTWRTLRKAVHETAKVALIRDQEQSCADSAARSRKNYKKDLE